MIRKIGVISNNLSYKRLNFRDILESERILRREIKGIHSPFCGSDRVVFRVYRVCFSFNLIGIDFETAGFYLEGVFYIILVFGNAIFGTGIKVSIITDRDIETNGTSNLEKVPLNVKNGTYLKILKVTFRTIENSFITIVVGIISATDSNYVSTLRGKVFENHKGAISLGVKMNCGSFNRRIVVHVNYKVILLAFGFLSEARDITSLKGGVLNDNRVVSMFDGAKSKIWVRTVKH